MIMLGVDYHAVGGLVFATGCLFVGMAVASAVLLVKVCAGADTVRRRKSTRL